MIEAPPDAAAASRVGHLWLTDFRVFREIDLELAPGLTVLFGANGQGKTSLLEAISWVARARSFRGVGDAMLVRAGEAQAILRAEVYTGERQQLFEAEIRASGRNRIQCNRQAVTRARDLHGLLRVTVFAPDDLALVKSGPADRRDYLDELLAMLAARYDAARSDYERVLKQRNALLRSGMRDPDAQTTLDVFDEQLAAAGAEITRGRLRLLERLIPAVAHAYRTFATETREVGGEYTSDWAGGVLTEADADDLEARLRNAIADRRRAEIDRGLTLVGPHRDELRLTIGGLDARHQASQGEQRTLALALRLAGHEVVRDLTGAAPVLLLDDVFSELDAARSSALVHNLPPGQTLVTTAGVLPPDVVAQRTLVVHDGTVDTR
ncbi:MAG TPA: DNA replication/repair protein RecF [Acidimicrobiia bacterium]|nr:DNA replication/repair protein RecF [Acidimicrobiia bacterium]